MVEEGVPWVGAACSMGRMGVLGEMEGPYDAKHGKEGELVGNATRKALRRTSALRLPVPVLQSGPQMPCLPLPRVARCVRHAHLHLVRARRWYAGSSSRLRSVVVVVGSKRRGGCAQGAPRPSTPSVTSASSAARPRPHRWWWGAGR